MERLKAFVIQIIKLSILVLKVQNTKYFQSFVINAEIQNTFICFHEIQNIFSSVLLKYKIQNTIVLYILFFK